MAEKARVAVIGTGWWSTYTHIPGLIEHPDAELVALCDRNPDALAAAAERYGIDRTYDDVGELLANEVSSMAPSSPSTTPRTTPSPGSASKPGYTSCSKSPWC